MKKIFFLFLSFIFHGIFAQKKADLIIHNANIYTVNSKFEIAEAMAVSDGKIVGIGKEKQILHKFRSDKKIDAGKKAVFPGFYDAHAHFFGYGSALQTANLRDIKSWNGILEILQKFAAEHPHGWLLGRGWDQNLWENKDFPTKEKLDELFPDRPVYLTRIDGHAAIVNQKALDIAKFNEKSKISGGEFILKNGKLTGVLIDKAKDQMSGYIPAPDNAQVKQIFLEAQKNCFAVGLTSIMDAGLDYDLVEEIQKLQKTGDLKMRLNVMLSDSQKNLDWILKNGKIRNPRLHVSGFKFYADGALGSRGACLLQDYNDQPHHKGFLLSDIAHFEKMAKIMYDHDLQMNTHAIGDSANRVLLKIYAKTLKGKNDRRWRIEHAQIIDPSDFALFGKYSIVPSVQPTHATSDMYWAKDRLGEKRLKSAYAYKELLDENGWIPLGTDFPIEEINPLLTFYAAVVRKDAKGFPAAGFQKENALSREEALRGMTIWAAKGAFEEKEKGSLEIGKFADFVILDQDLMKVPKQNLLKTKVVSTYLNGEKVFEQQ